MRIELLEYVAGIGTAGEQADLNETLAMQLITERKAIDVDACTPGAKRGRIAQPIWAAQDAAALLNTDTAKNAPRNTAPKK